MIWEIIRFFIYSGLIVLISKYILVTTLRKLAENLNLKARTVGNIAGYATSMPELLTVSTASLSGLASASVINILSSNIINLIQYIGAIFLNKNIKAIKNKAIRADLILVIITILIPSVLIWLNLEMNIIMVPIFLAIYAIFICLNNRAHKLYLKKEDKELEKEIEEEEEKEQKNKKKIVLYSICLLGTGILLFLIGELLGNTLDNLCFQFNLSQTIIGILLGFTTSIPELITFFEAQKHYKKQKQDEMLGVVEATNNLLTSNLLNLFIIQSFGILLFTFIH